MRIKSSQKEEEKFFFNSMKRNLMSSKLKLLRIYGARMIDKVDENNNFFVLREWMRARKAHLLLYVYLFCNIFSFFLEVL